MPLSIRPHRRLVLAYLSGFWLLITLLVLSSGPAYAEWVRVGGDDEAEVTTYVDPDTIRRKGNLVKVWDLFDFKTRQTIGSISFSSSKELAEYDCAEERVRQLTVTYFLRNMGAGKVVHADREERKWSPIEPGSVGERLWEVVCRKQ